MTPRPALILASSSRYRAALLHRLGVPFKIEAPAADERGLPDEAPAARARRLARVKAKAIAQRHPGAWVLGSDQVAIRDGSVLGKPGNAARCQTMLLGSSGKRVVFHTAACLMCVAEGRTLEHMDETRVCFRRLSRAEVRRYVALDRPFDCAGGFRSEGLGIALFDRIESEDPTALVGLPLIWVAEALRQAGLDPLGAAGNL